MGMEQGGYTTDAGGGDDFVYGYGGGGDEVSIDLGSGIDIGDADFYYGYGFDTGAEYGDSGYSPGGGNLFDAYTDFYTESGFDLMTAMELAAQEVAAGSTKIVTDEYGPLPDISNQPFYGLPYIPDSFLTPYTPIFPDLPEPLPPVITPLIPLNVQPPPQVPLPQIPTPGPQPIAPGLPPACPSGQYRPFPIGHPDQNKCVPFPPAQTGSRPQAQPKPSAAPGGTASTSKPPAQKPPAQQACPKGYYRDPATGQCKPIPQGQPQACPSGYFRASNGQCLPIPKCTTPGTVFDQATGLCVPKDQAISPLPEGVEGLFDELSKLPWWVWLALGGLILLSRDGEGGKRTTVTYRRAR